MFRTVSRGLDVARAEQAKGREENGREQREYLSRGKEELYGAKAWDERIDVQRYLRNPAGTLRADFQTWELEGSKFRAFGHRYFDSAAKMFMNCFSRSSSWFTAILSAMKTRVAG